MDILNTFLTLLSKTQGRDKVLRLVQYFTLHSTELASTTPTLNVYNQIRTTRKVLRLLRTLQYSKKIREEVPKMKEQLGNHLIAASHGAGILQNLFTFLFYLSDHRVLLAELKVIDESYKEVHYPRSYKFYFLQNLFGIIKDVLEIIVIIIEGKYQGELLDMQSGSKIIKQKVFDMVKCFLDLSVALFYLSKKTTAKKAGIIGTVTSLMAIVQTLKLI